MGKDIGQLRSNCEVALAAAPHGELTVTVPHGQGIVILNVALMDHRTCEFVLYDYVGFREPRLDVAFLIQELLGNIAGFVRQAPGELRIQIFVQKWRVWFHCGPNVHDGW